MILTFSPKIHDLADSQIWRIQLTDLGRIRICFVAQSDLIFSNTNKSENNNKD